MPHDDYETQITCEEYYANEAEYAIASYGDPFSDESSDDEQWTNEEGNPLEPEDFMNGELFDDDGNITEHGMELLATLEQQGAFT